MELTSEEIDESMDLQWAVEKTEMQMKLFPTALMAEVARRNELDSSVPSGPTGMWSSKLKKIVEPATDKYSYESMCEELQNIYSYFRNYFKEDVEDQMCKEMCYWMEFSNEEFKTYLRNEHSKRAECAANTCICEEVIGLIPY